MTDSRKQQEAGLLEEFARRTDSHGDRGGQRILVSTREFAVELAALRFCAPLRQFALLEPEQLVPLDRRVRLLQHSARKDQISLGVVSSSGTDFIVDGTELRRNGHLHF